MNRTVKRNNIKIIAIMVASLIIMVIVISFSAKVVRSTQEDAIREQYYAGLEKEYKSMLREYMNDNGYTNAGITVTHIVDCTGDRTYTVKIHHSKFDRLDESERYSLAEDVIELGFEDEKCYFVTEFVK